MPHASLTMHIDAVDLSAQDPAEAREFLRGALPAQEADRCGRYLHAIDHVRSAAGYLLTARAAGGGTPPVITRNRLGKPSVLGRPDFHHSVSHSGDWVAVATATAPVGLDIEIRRDLPFHETALAMTPTDRALLATGGLSFYDLWTAKEAYAKLIGQGLHADFTRFDAPAPRRTGHVEFFGGLDVHTLRLPVLPGHCLTLAARSPFTTLVAVHDLRDLVAARHQEVVA